MKNLILILSLFLFITSCNKNDEIDDKYPKCMQSTIDNYLLEVEPQTSRANIKKYRYLGEVVYAFDLGSLVDRETTIFNGNCEVICGFGGVLQINTCENWESAEFIETVWEDPR